MAQHQNNQQMNIQREVRGGKARHDRDFICFKCNKPGHKRRDCRRNLNGQGRRYQDHCQGFDANHLQRSPNAMEGGYKDPFLDIPHQKNKHGHQEGNVKIEDAGRGGKDLCGKNEPAGQNLIPVNDELQNPTPLNFQ